MTKGAEQHLAKARDYVARGEEFYRKAAEEIIAARNEGATVEECAESIDRSKTWVLDTLKWYLRNGQSTRGGRENAPTPYAEQAGAVAQRHARSVLRQAPAEQIAEMLSDPAVRAKVSKAQHIAHERVEQGARQAVRESIGDAADDALTQETILNDAELELFKARRCVITTLRKVNDAGGDIPDAWREEFLRTLDDLDAKVAVLRDLLTGISVDDLDRLLAEEV